MKVSCICPTYNRVASNKYFIDEAVKSFLLQTYLNKELIIVNDHPQQKIVFSHPQIRILNINSRFSTLGDKYNYAIEQSTGDLICPWEDDDISLPHRIKYSVKELNDCDYYNPKSYFFQSKTLFHHSVGKGYAHNASIYTKKVWEKVGGYASITGAQDAEMDTKLRNKSKYKLGFIGTDKTFYIYRWGMGNGNLSAAGKGKQQKRYDDYALKATESGTYKIEPQWKEDYVSLVKELQCT